MMENVSVETNEQEKQTNEFPNIQVHALYLRLVTNALCSNHTTKELRSSILGRQDTQRSISRLTKLFRHMTAVKCVT